MRVLFCWFAYPSLEFIPFSPHHKHSHTIISLYAPASEEQQHSAVFSSPTKRRHPRAKHTKTADMSMYVAGGSSSFPVLSPSLIVSRPCPPPPPSSPNPRYVRIKRKQQTIFLHVEQTETVQGVKAQLGEIVGQSPADIRLFGSDKVRMWLLLG